MVFSKSQLSQNLPQKHSKRLTNFCAPFFKEIPSFFCGVTPSKNLAAPQPLNIAFPLGNGGVLRSEEGGGIREGRGRWGGGIRNSILRMASRDLINTKTHNSRSNSGSDSRNCREPTRKIFIRPCILGAFFQELGWSPRTRLMVFRKVSLARICHKSTPREGCPPWVDAKLF